VIEIDRRHDGHVRVHDIHGIEASAKADFEDRDVELRAREQPQRGERSELEVREGDRCAAFHARILDAVERFDERDVRRFDAVDPHPFVVAEQVRRRVQADAKAGAAEHALEHRARRSLAVRPGDGDDRAGHRRLQAHVDGAHAIEAESDRLRVQRLEITEPIGERRGS